MSAPLRPGTQRCLACHSARPIGSLWLVEGAGEDPAYLCRDRPECRAKLGERGLGQVQLSFPHDCPPPRAVNRAVRRGRRPDGALL